MSAISKLLRKLKAFQHSADSFQLKQRIEAGLPIAGSRSLTAI